MIVTVSSLRKHKNADSFQCTSINGRSLIVDQSCRIGQRMVYLPPGCQLDEKFAKDNNLLRKKDIEGNPKGGYLYTKTRVIRPIWLRGEIYEGLLLPVEVLS